MVNPTNQEHNERFNVLLFASAAYRQKQIFRNKSSFALFTPTVTPSSCCVRGVSSICDP